MPAPSPNLDAAADGLADGFGAAVIPRKIGTKVGATVGVWVGASMFTSTVPSSSWFTTGGVIGDTSASTAALEVATGPVGSAGGIHP